jgi:hypothetical protein
MDTEKYLEGVDDESRPHVKRNLETLANAISGLIGKNFMGGFCTAVWNNDLNRAFNNADKHCTKYMKVFVQFVNDHAPGNREKI